MVEQSSTIEVYQLHVWLHEITPLIWRQVLVRSDSSIVDLHYTLQIAMGWDDAHLHRFRIRGKDYGISRIGGIGFHNDPHQVRLCDFHFRPNERFLYEYDFGDLWQHVVRVERRLPWDRKRTYPVRIGGQRAAPPEDCGGAWAYMQLVDRHHVPLEAMAVVATVLNRLLEADGQTTIRQVIGDREALREAVDQLDAYLQFGCVPPACGSFSRLKNTEHLSVSPI